jgi:Domain of unknown function (DUF2431)
MPKKRKRPSSTKGLTTAEVAAAKVYFHSNNGVADSTTQNNNEDSTTTTSLPPIRNVDQLYASQETVQCALQVDNNNNNNSGCCVPCAYKICCFDVAQDVDFGRQCPNKRPENCPRSGSTKTTTTTTTHTTTSPTTCATTCVFGMRPGMTILTVGDGDFSFSLGMARRLVVNNGNNSLLFLSTTKIIATSYETKETLQKVYGTAFDETVQELKSLGVLIAYQVDATRLTETLKPYDLIDNDTAFHRIIWNFPCTAAPSGQDGQNQEMEDNKQLVRGFVNSARLLLSRGDGEIHMSHKTKPPYNQWNLPEIAVSGQPKDTMSSSSSSSPPLRPPLLHYAGRIVLDRNLIPPYTPRKALDRKSFPCHDACVFVFAQQQQQQQQQELSPHRSPSSLFPPTIPGEPNGNADGGHPTDNAPSSLVKVDSELILSIRRRHLQLVSAAASSSRTTKRHRRNKK